MLKYSLIFGVALAALAGTYWFSNPRAVSPTNAITESVGEQKSELTPVPVDNTPMQIETVPTPGMKVYRNDEFGFEFQYPSDWNIRSPEFGSKVSLMNMGLKPTDYEGTSPIYINITPKEWIENALAKMRARGVVTKDVMLDGKAALELEDTDRFSAPAILTFVLVEDKFWIDITGVKTHEDAYRAVLSSFKFFE